MQAEELELKEKEERGEEMGREEEEEEVHFLPFTARTWGSFLPWKEILLPHVVGSKDGSSESRHIPAQQVPPVSEWV